MSRMTTHAHRAHDRHEPEGVVVSLTCCACTTRAMCFVLDGAFHKPACEQHGRMYRQQGFRVKPIAATNPRATARKDGGES